MGSSKTSKSSNLEENMHIHHKLKCQEAKEKPGDSKRESSIYLPVYLLETNSDKNGRCEQESHLDNTLFSQYMTIP